MCKKKLKKCLYCDFKTVHVSSLKRHASRRHKENYKVFLLWYNKKYGKQQRDFSFHCLNCDKFNKNEKKDGSKKFCNQKCSAVFNNKKRKKPTKEQRKKTSESLKKSWRKRKEVKVFYYEGIVEYVLKKYIESPGELSVKSKSHYYSYKHVLTKEERNSVKKEMFLLKIKREKKELRSLAKDIDSRESFFLEYYTEYRRALLISKKYEKGFFDSICSHMKSKGNLLKRCIYVIMFKKQKTVYVGLTYNLKERIRRHINKPSNKRLIKMMESIPYVVEKKTDYIDVNEAIKKEGEVIESYKRKNWITLNIAKAGAVGSTPIYWTEERIIRYAKRYKKYKNFYKNKNLYRAAIRRKLLPKIKKEIFGIE